MYTIKVTPETKKILCGRSLSWDDAAIINWRRAYVGYFNDCERWKKAPEWVVPGIYKYLKRGSAA